jgi:CRP/FNR family transcriptional regulator, cyclic AMP receptor protein
MGPTMKQDASFAVLTGNNIDAKPLKAGSVIFREGDEARELFVIKSGEVRIQIGNRTVTDLKADSIFGEMALIDNDREARRPSRLPMSNWSRFPKSNSCFW